MLAASDPRFIGVLNRLGNGEVGEYLAEVSKGEPRAPLGRLGEWLIQTENMGFSNRKNH